MKDARKNAVKAIERAIDEGYEIVSCFRVGQDHGFGSGCG